MNVIERKLMASMTDIRIIEMKIPLKYVEKSYKKILIYMLS